MAERIRIGFDETIYPSFGRSAKQRKLCEYGFEDDDEEGLIISETDDEDCDESAEERFEHGLGESIMYKDEKRIDKSSIIPLTRYGKYSNSFACDQIF